MDGIARISETHRTRDMIFFALFGNELHFLPQPRYRSPGDAHVAHGMIPDFEAVAMEFRDLLPCHVVGLVSPEIEALCDEERGVESQLLQQRPHAVILRRDGVIER